MSNIIAAKNLNFSYGENQVIHNLNLNIKEGKITTLIGANGCGKSTLFGLLTKNLKPDSGEIFLEDKNIREMKLKEFAKNVAIVHQYNTAPMDVTVEQLVAYGRTPYHSICRRDNIEQDEERIRRAMEITNIYDIRNRNVAELSGGQKQRVWIAMSLAQDTRILFLDEPTTYLDIRYQLEILKIIRRLNREFQMTIIMVLHDLNQSLFYSDELVAMSDGKILASGNPKQVLTRQMLRDIYHVDLKITEVEQTPFVIPI